MTDQQTEQGEQVLTDEQAKSVRPTREMCSECGEVSRVGFYVPDEVWSQVVPDDRAQDIFCVRCWTRLADRKQVRWSDTIQFFPVDKATHRKHAESAYERITALEAELEQVRSERSDDGSGARCEIMVPESPTAPPNREKLKLLLPTPAASYIDSLRSQLSHTQQDAHYMEYRALKAEAERDRAHKVVEAARNTLVAAHEEWIEHGAIESPHVEARIIESRHALNEYLQSLSTHDEKRKGECAGKARWYHADGTVEWIDAQECERRRITAAKVLEAARNYRDAETRLDAEMDSRSPEEVDEAKHDVDACSRALDEALSTHDQHQGDGGLEKENKRSNSPSNSDSNSADLPEPPEGWEYERDEDGTPVCRVPELGEHFLSASDENPIPDKGKLITTQCQMRDPEEIGLIFTTPRYILRRKPDAHTDSASECRTTPETSTPSEDVSKADRYEGMMRKAASKAADAGDYGTALYYKAKADGVAMMAYSTPEESTEGEDVRGVVRRAKVEALRTHAEWCRRMACQASNWLLREHYGLAQSYANKLADSLESEGA